MSRIMHRDLCHPPPIAVRARGATITDSSGRVYLDASAGAAVSALGHGHPAVLAAIRAQLEQVEYAHTAFFTTAVAEELAARLAHLLPAGEGHVYFVSGGSEAMETALKLARQYYVEIGEPQRTRFVARRQSYHGNTLGALAVGGNEQRRHLFAPLLMDVIRVAPCYEYRGREEGQSREEYTAMLLRQLEAAFVNNGPGTIAAFVAEPVVGATAGALPPTPGYFRGVRELCDKYGILFIADEVMCGMGRCGTMLALQAEGVAADITTVAKGLAAGYQPMGAVLAQARIADAIRARSGAFLHGHTYVGHPCAAAAALAVQQVIERDGLLEQVKQRGATLQALLGGMFGSHPHVGDIRGRGLLLALELVADRASKRPFAPARRLHAEVKAQAMRRGLMVYPMGGTIDGTRGDHVLLAPPFTCSEDELAEIARRLRDALDAALAQPCG